VPIELFRIDDRLIHGQVVVGWGQPLDVGFIVLVDDEVATSEWEQELYRLGVPPGMAVHFETVAEAADQFARYNGERQVGILLTKDIETMRRLATGVPQLRTINLGGLHYSAGRVQKLRYVFLSPGEEQVLRDLASRGVEITAQDVPASRPVSLDALLEGRGT
jgi:PTS system mannose-specific IIB component/fructoselysine and glucoselysine-specific PTS system IIB component